MDITLIADTVTVATQHGLGFAKSLIHRHNFISNNNLSLSDSPANQSAGGIIQISAAILDAIAPPPVKSNRFRTGRRNLLRKRRRTRRSSHSGGESDDGGEDYIFFWGGDNDGPFGGGGGNWGGGGRGWNFDKFGGQNWDESSSWSSSSSDFAYGFVYEVVCWIALSNCVHFAFKKVVRIVADGVAVDDTGREKIPIRLGSI